MTQAEPGSTAGDRPDVFADRGDVFLEIPLASLLPAPWNPKKRLRDASPRRYKGLQASLDAFGLRDDLKVWPIPGRVGSYYALDGNQRLDALWDAALRVLHDREYGPDWRPPRPGEAVDDDVARRMRELRAQAGARLVRCRVLADLDPADAKLLTATFDRHHAAYDEGKQADLYDEIRAERAAQLESRREELGDSLARRREEMESRLKALVAPDRPDEAPPASFATSRGLGLPAPDHATDPTPGSPALPLPLGSAESDLDEPWGPPPPVTSDAGPAGRIADGSPARPMPEPMGMLVFSMPTSEIAELEAGILRCKARLIRSRHLLSAVLAIAEAPPDREFSDRAVEIALVILNRGVPLLEPEDEAADGEPE